MPPSRINGPRPPIVRPPSDGRGGPSSGSNATGTETSDRFEANRPRGIEAFFTPDDDAQRLELAHIDEVIAARRRDPKRYPPAGNPYRIEYAIYNMTDRAIITRLIDAARAGVRVQVLIDANQIGPHKPHNTVVNELTAAGFTHAESQRGLAPEALRDTQIVEIDMPGEGLFHFKSRYYAYPDPTTGKLKETLLTGSHNPQNSAHKNDESLHRITDPALIRKYVEAFHALRDGHPIQNEWSDASPVNVLFTSGAARGTKPVDKIFELIDRERELVFLTMFSLRNLVSSHGERLVDRLIAAHRRGVKVVVVTDRKASDGIELDGSPREGSHDDRTDELLERAGIPVYEYMNPSGPRTAMHLKSAVFGLKNIQVVTDTGNWTLATMGNGGSRGKNAESILFIESGRYDGNAIGERYLAEFLRVLRKYAGQNAGTGRQDVEALISELQRHPSWPKVSVSFDALGRAHAGHEVYLVGDRPELKPARPGEPGLRLRTDEGAAGGSTRIDLPLGTRLEYRVLRRDERGGIAAPDTPAIVVVEGDLSVRVDEG